MLIASIFHSIEKPIGARNRPKPSISSGKSDEIRSALSFIYVNVINVYKLGI